MSVGGLPDHRINLGAVRALQVIKHHNSHRCSAWRLEQSGICGMRAGKKREQTDRDDDAEKSLHTRITGFGNPKSFSGAKTIF